MNRQKAPETIFDRSRLKLLVLLTLLLSHPAYAVIITKNFTGQWDQSEQESQSFVLQIVQDDAGDFQAVAYWLTYDEMGDPIWMKGSGEIEDNTVEMEMEVIEGPTFLQPKDPTTRNKAIAGNLSLEFSSCDSGIGTFSSTNGVSGTGGAPFLLANSASFQLERATSIATTSCSGGVSDNTPANAHPLDIELMMNNLGTYPLGTARVRYERRSDRTKFDIELEDLPIGVYALLVNGEERGQIEVIQLEDGAIEGEIEFQSPPDEDELLLDFEPLGQLLEITEQGNVLFDLLLEAPGTGGGGDDGSGGGDDGSGGGDDGSGGGDRCEDDVEDDSCSGDGTDPGTLFVEEDIEFDLTNSGILPNAEGEVRYESEPDKIEFRVKIEDVPMGEYQLFIGGIERATLMITTGGFFAEGKFEFHLPQKDEGQLLDFDPHGELIEIKRQGLVVLEGTMPD